MLQVSSMAIEPPTTLRRIGRVFGEPEITALALGIALAGDRDVLAHRHRRGSGQQAAVAPYSRWRRSIADRIRYVATVRTHPTSSASPRRCGGAVAHVAATTRTAAPMAARIKSAAPRGQARNDLPFR